MPCLVGKTPPILIIYLHTIKIFFFLTNIFDIYYPTNSWTIRQKWPVFTFLPWILVVWVRHMKPATRGQNHAGKPLTLTRTGQNGCLVTESIDSERGGTPVTLCDLYIAVQVNAHFHLNTFQEDTWQELALTWDSWQCLAVMRGWLYFRQSLTGDPQFTTVM